MEIGRSERRTAFGILLLLGGMLALAPDLPVRAEIGAIHVYQRFGSEWAGRVVTCRFRPTCSHYAVAALQNRGFWRGNAHIVRRLSLCSPLGWALSIGGDDPPPG